MYLKTTMGKKAIKYMLANTLKTLGYNPSKTPKLKIEDGNE